MEELLPNGVVRCHLSPRNCTLKEGQHGFCGVRANRNGRLVTLNYGKSVHATEETIETEAVNHFSPGERILSMGNIGCMLNCAYCHNWKTSQAKYVSDKDVHYYTPEQVVDIALQHNIRMLSWTYNDPVVWHEFVRETAKLAREKGLMNLYKSAFYITPEAIDELLPYMDIFSISLKAIDEEYYRKITTGRLQPVLDAIKHVYKSGVHLEVSNLMITDLSDDEASARKLAEWMLKETDSTVPLHYVRFHPDYRMRDSVRTPIPRLLRAREIAIEMGVEHVYLGNVYDTPFSNTFCNGCGGLLVDRYGLNAKLAGLDARGHCSKCGKDAHIKMRGTPLSASSADSLPTDAELSRKSFQWHGDVRSLHVQVQNPAANTLAIYVRRMLAEGQATPWRLVTLRPQESFRFIVAQNLPNELGCEVAMPPVIQSNLHEVFDRAHFPTVAIEEVGVQQVDVTPLPSFR
ncbi:AmmeMemoRadiSam system radical SAM enzyme [Corallococcus llansteffanensis]|uniref:AmmeMemoRadiSam system radical SAM enzyme n=2 Tax=Corallococcus llansteffanensis TaxID=2316731 RepID=A0A3A8PIU4_9BACT|nr:AmmeMemoRadiSam system radical SAM enzyme [Corallococcus llansteffanensis]RKH56238.1 AmmeMemoRadiSam system radical SAM enzyme [Corallococcus llansteffanensis]